MFVTGTHAAHRERALRGSRWLWNGLQGPSAIPAVFRDRSFHSPDSSVGLRITAAGGGEVRRGFKGYQPVPFDGIIVGCSLIADRAGSIVFDIYRSSAAAFPPRPSGSLMTLSAFRPALNGQQAMLDNALFGWHTALTKGEILGFDVLSASGINTVTLTLIISANHRP